MPRQTKGRQTRPSTWSEGPRPALPPRQTHHRTAASRSHECPHQESKAAPLERFYVSSEMAEHCREKKVPMFYFLKVILSVFWQLKLLFCFPFQNHFSGLWSPLCCLSGPTNAEGAVCGPRPPTNRDLTLVVDRGAGGPRPPLPRRWRRAPQWD